MSTRPNTPTTTAQPGIAGRATDPNENLTRRERRRREVFARIMGAVYELVFTRHLDESTVQEIADKADVGKGTFFNYFRTKQHVVPEFITQATRRMERTVEIARAGQMNPREALIDLLTKSGPNATPHEWESYYSSILRSLSYNLDIRRETAQRLLQTRAAYSDLIALGQQRRVFRTDVPAADLGHCVHAMLMGILLTDWIRGESPRLSENEPRIALLLDGLTGPPTGAKKATSRRIAKKAPIPARPSIRARHPPARRSGR